MPELRKDPIVDRWVIISTERGKRPKDFPSPAPKTSSQTCPFCYGNEAMTPPEILVRRPAPSTPNSPGWTLWVVSNKFPALRIEGDIQRTREGLYDRMNGIGAHEVIIESPDHNTGMELLPQKSFEDCLWAFRERTLDLKKDPRFKYILIFKNHGEAAGASLEHTHCQLIALPIVPELVQEELAGCERHFRERGGCIFCDLVAGEREDGRRMVLENDLFVAMCPYAPRFPFETWILPRYHSARFEESGPEQFSHLAALLKEILMRMRVALGAPPYNFLLHTAPIFGNHDKKFHWHIEIMPKLTKMAGFEQGTGFYINPTLPEEAAKILRSTIPNPASVHGPKP